MDMPSVAVSRMKPRLETTLLCPVLTWQLTLRRHSTAKLPSYLIALERRGQANAERVPARNRRESPIDMLQPWWVGMEMTSGTAAELACAASPPRRMYRDACHATQYYQYYGVCMIFASY
ncbi:uncharacterized protein PV09_04195 [Verruconis gallopava]|uniref:Uncharacterized protein n=1 Tax=Verruconis gallopava TaxID=253628 RepID=A0A0D2B158_9PEZI|nr:uncharacterized protein PV09_04195 [Verruconis gallopava]KIW05039.1 hypothetical protein PV09_04195 [Verruconis gallopava]